MLIYVSLYIKWHPKCHNFEEYVTSTNERHNVLDHWNMNGAVAISATDAAILMAWDEAGYCGRIYEYFDRFSWWYGSHRWVKWHWDSCSDVQCMFLSLCVCCSAVTDCYSDSVDILCNDCRAMLRLSNIVSILCVRGAVVSADHTWHVMMPQDVLMCM